MPEGARRLDLPHAVLLPGLINTHTHLELTAMGEPPEEEDFLAWLQVLIRLRSEQSEEQLYQGAVAGIRAGWAGGVTTVCDTGSTGVVIAALHQLGASGIAHHEVFGPDPAQLETVFPEYQRSLNRLARYATGRVSLGLSPHAPYSVSGPLYRATAALARAHGAPLAVHIAESPAESALLGSFTGSFAGLFQRRGITRPSAEPVSPLQWIASHEVLGPRTLCIHAVQCSTDDITVLAGSGSAVAHCPRSNRRHHHTDAPVRAILDAGIRVGVGTDSALSVAPPDLRAEARAARRLAGWSARETIHAITAGGAEALGLADVGVLRPGAWADLIAIELAQDADPEEAVVASAGPVFKTWLAGVEVQP